MSLIELIVVVSMVSVTVLTITIILFNSFQANNKVVSLEKLGRNGNGAVEQIQRLLLGADPTSIVCPTLSKDQITFSSRTDGELTTLRCTEGVKIASVSANPADLTGSDVVVNGCSDFIHSCDASGLSPALEIGFSLATDAVANPGNRNYSAKPFGVKVIVRR